MNKIILVFSIFLTFSFAKSEELTVSILPQKYFLQKIVKDKYNINVMVKPGSSPHMYEPKASQMRSLIQSKAYFYMGVSFENVWLEKFKQTAKDTLFVDSTKGIEKIAMLKHEHHDDEEKGTSHEEHHEIHHEEHHDEEGLDPHIWLDPILVKTQAKNIYETMIKIDSKNSEFYKQNYEVFLKELDILDSKLNEILKPFEHKSFMVFHPSWGYFAKRYNLEQIAVEFEGKEPKPNELVELIDDAKKHNIKIVFVSPQFSQKSAKTISKNIGGNVVVINPLSENWDEELINSANEISKSYK